MAGLLVGMQVTVYVMFVVRLLIFNIAVVPIFKSNWPFSRSEL